MQFIVCQLLFSKCFEIHQKYLPFLSVPQVDPIPQSLPNHCIKIPPVAFLLPLSMPNMDPTDYPFMASLFSVVTVSKLLDQVEKHRPCLPEK